MILFTILLLMAFILTVFTIIAVSVGGAAFIIVFGDVIVCIAIIVWFMKRLRNRKNKR